MKNWGYNELFEAIKEDYNDFLKLHRGHEYAIARTVNDYINLGEVEDFIVDTAVGELLLSHEKIFVGYIEGITNRLYNFSELEVTNDLTEDEIADLTNRIKKVMAGLKKVEADYNPYTE